MTADKNGAGPLDLARAGAALTAEVQRRGGQLRGGEWVLRCPAPEHDDEHPSAGWTPSKAGGVWCCYARHCERQHGGKVVDLAKLLGVDLAPFREPGARSKSPASRLVAWAECRGLDAAELGKVWGVRVAYDRRRGWTLQYPTVLGVDRVKYLDGVRPKYKWKVAGKGHAHWYGLPGALQQIECDAGATVLFVVNGEPAVWGCYRRRVPAVCLASGEGAAKAAGKLAPDLATALAAVGRPIAVRVVFDADDAGRAGGPAVAAALAAAGLDAAALDLTAAGVALPSKGDVGDLAAAVGGRLAAVLAELPVLAPAVDAGGQAPAVDDAGGGGGGVSGVSTVMGVSGVSVHRQTLSARDLMALEIPPARYVVRPILPEGLALLAGKGKIGKSFLALQLACACASGGQFLGVRVDRCDVLYLALEDGKRRLRDRMRGMLQGDTIPAGLHFDTSDSGDYWRQPDGLERIKAWCDEHPDAGLVIIDVLAKVRPRRVSNRAAYDEDYAAVEGLQQLATERRICILVLTHVRKMVAEDWVDCVTGTTGVTGAVDTILGMMRERGAADAALKGTGRDLDDFAWALSRDGMTGGWTLEGNAADVALSKARREILDALGEMGTGTPRAVANHLGRDDKGYQSLRQLMPKMAREGLLLGDGEAGYKLSGRLPISDHTTHTDHTTHSDHTDNGAAGSVSDDPLQWNETP